MLYIPIRNANKRHTPRLATISPSNNPHPPSKLSTEQNTAT
jgi:hypothetical protein